MTPEQFINALAKLGWKQSDFCRKTGASKNTPSRWVNGETRIQPWVSAYLGAMQDLADLHAKYVAPDKRNTDA
jgi:transcriptional regulator with XRE-family HTH domain